MSDSTCGGGSGCQSCGSASACSQEDKQRHEQELIARALGSIGKKFMVLSGKGGVGKSSVAVNLAATLAARGKKVGILDADMHGPNIPKMFGLDEDKPEPVPGLGFLPVCAADNLHVMSVGFFLKSEDHAVVWRGPMKHGVIKQFLGEVQWGTLDYLIIDLPPGTGDEALSIAHIMGTVDGAVIVTTPQDVALLDSKKSISFCKELKIPLIGVVENMSGMLCPHCGKEIDLFKVGGGETIAKKMKVPFLGRVPLDPAMVLCGDEGKPFVTAHPSSPAAEAFAGIADAWENLLATGPNKSFFQKIFS
jgi:Mrp family chromosome partitioning ATPase